MNQLTNKAPVAVYQLNHHAQSSTYVFCARSITGGCSALSRDCTKTKSACCLSAHTCTCRKLSAGDVESFDTTSDMRYICKHQLGNSQ